MKSIYFSQAYYIRPIAQQRPTPIFFSHPKLRSYSYQGLHYSHSLDVDLLPGREAMHLPKNHVPPGIGNKLRFQTTAQMAMHEVRAYCVFDVS